MLAMTYSPFKESTIGARRLNYRVRNENGCTPSAESPTYKIHTNLGCSFLEYWKVILTRKEQVSLFIYRSERRVGGAGFEPATTVMSGPRSTRLSYPPVNHFSVFKFAYPFAYEPE